MWTVAGQFAPGAQGQERVFGGTRARCHDVGPASPINTCVVASDDVLFIVTSSEFVHITEAIKAIG